MFDKLVYTHNQTFSLNIFGENKIKMNCSVFYDVQMQSAEEALSALERYFGGYSFDGRLTCLRPAPVLASLKVSLSKNVFGAHLNSTSYQNLDLQIALEYNSHFKTCDRVVL